LRNELVHVYDEEMAKRIYSEINKKEILEVVQMRVEWVK